MNCFTDMTKTQFYTACGERLLDPNIVLEHEGVQDALRERDDEKVIHILDTEF